MARISHGTLTANAVTSVTLDPCNSQVTIINRTRSGEIYFTVDGTDPTIGGNNSFVCLGTRPAAVDYMTAPTVKLISNTALLYSVIGETQ